MFNLMIISIILVVGGIALLWFIFWNIFKSSKKTIKFYHKSKIFGENFLEHSD